VAAFLQGHTFFQADAAKAACAIIDPTKFNPVAVNLITNGLMPVDASGAIVPTGPHTSNDNELTMKFDLNVTQRDKISATIGGFRNPILHSFSTPINTTFPAVPSLPVPSPIPH